MFITDDGDRGKLHSHGQNSNNSTCIYYTVLKLTRNLFDVGREKYVESKLDRQGSFQELTRNVGWDIGDKILKKHVVANCKLVPIDLNLQLIFSED